MFTDIVNECVSTGPVPDSLKQAIVKPLLKKMSLDLNVPPQIAKLLTGFELSVKNNNCLYLSMPDRGAWTGHVPTPWPSDDWQVRGGSPSRSSARHADSVHADVPPRHVCPSLSTDVEIDDPTGLLYCRHQSDTPGPPRCNVTALP